MSEHLHRELKEGDQRIRASIAAGRYLASVLPLFFVVELLRRARFPDGGEREISSPPIAG